MIPSLARQAVIIKCKNDTSILTGNYELAYSLGLIAHLTDIAFPSNYEGVKDLQEKILQTLANQTFTDERERRLYRMLKLYRPTEDFDGQMEELIQMGLSEKYPWDMFHT